MSPVSTYKRDAVTRKEHIPRFLALLAMLSSFAGVTYCARAQESPSAPEVAFHTARELFDNGKFPEALAAFQKIEDQYRLSSIVPRVLYFKGACLAAQHQAQQAADAFAYLITNYPHSAIVPEAIFKEAECYRELNDFPKAMKLYRQCLTQSETNALLPHVMLGEAWVSLQQHDVKTANEILQKVQAQSTNDPSVFLDAQFLLAAIDCVRTNYAAARDVYQQIASQEKSPRAAEALVLAGEAMFTAQRYTEALPFYQKVPSATNATNQLHSFALFREANCYQSLNRLTEASAAYRKFLETYPGNKLTEQARFALTQILTELHQTGDADRELKAIQKQYPSSSLSARAVFLEAEILFNSGKFREALRYFQKCATISRDPSVLENASFRAAVCRYKLLDFEAAREGFITFTKTFSGSPLMPDALFFMGRCDANISKNLTDPDAIQTNLLTAVKHYEFIRANYPTNELVPEVTFQLGDLYASLGADDGTNYDKAAVSFQEFISRWPDNPLVPAALYQIAHVRFAQSQFDAAITAYKKLIDKYPDSELTPFARYEVANCYARANQSAQMTTALLDFVKQHPNHIRAANAFYAIASQFKDSTSPADFRIALDRLASQ